MITKEAYELTLVVLRTAIREIDSGSTIQSVINTERPLLPSLSLRSYKDLEMIGWIHVFKQSPRGHSWGFNSELFDKLETDTIRFIGPEEWYRELEPAIQDAWNKLRSLVRIVQKLEIYQC